MCEINFKSGNKRIDPCMRDCIYLLKLMKNDKANVVACCCGHKKYHKTIVIETKYKGHWDLLSGIPIPRQKRFYKKDKEGYYFIPEVEEYYKNVRKQTKEC